MGDPDHTLAEHTAREPGEKAASVLSSSSEGLATKIFPEVFDTERAELIKNLPLSTIDINSASWACLWLSDIEKLREIHLKLNGDDEAVFDTQLELLRCSTTVDGLKAWTTRLKKLQGSESTSEQMKEANQKLNTNNKKRKLVDSELEATSINSGSATRAPLSSDIMKKWCRKRDKNTCLVTMAEVAIEVAHVFPQSLGWERNMKKEKLLWRTLGMFWDKKKIQAWKDVISDTCGVDTLCNMMCLKSDIHDFWKATAFALKPLKLEDDCKTLWVEFYWLCPQEFKSVVQITTPPSVPECPPDRGLKNIKAWNVRTEKKLLSGDILAFKTKDPAKLPLPSVEILNMQWLIMRLLAISGAAEAPDDDDTPPDTEICLSLFGHEEEEEVMEEEEEEDVVMVVAERPAIAPQEVPRIGENVPFRQVPQYPRGEQEQTSQDDPVTETRRLNIR